MSSPVSSISRMSSPDRPNRPVPKEKPLNLRGNSIDGADEGLDGDLLSYGDERRKSHTPQYESRPQTPQQNGDTGHNIGASNKLVVAVDFGTTFTGKCACAWCSLQPSDSKPKVSHTPRQIIHKKASTASELSMTTDVE